MFNVDVPEFIFVAVLALIVIGPKDLPKVMRVVGQWVGKARATARQFRSGFDDMMRESELAEMEKKWQAENERIMREFPTSLTDETPLVAEAAPTEPPPASPAKRKRTTKPKASNA
jgi:sec-independent protein translocase protein TatB